MFFFKYFLSFLACPAGYFGTNCSEKCWTHNYGIGCSRTCECSPCHHIYGCLLVTTVKPMQGMRAVSVESSIAVQSETEMSQSKSNDLYKYFVRYWI